jgi:carbonic anhydrase
MGGLPQTQEYNFHSDLISLKSFIMKLRQHNKALATALCFAILFSACQGTGKEQPKASDSGVSSEHPHADSALSDDEVKVEAPDAAIKIDQGYALPKHGSDVAQSPVDIITNKAEQAGKNRISFAFHSAFDTAENLGHTVQVDFKKGSFCIVNGKDYASRQFHFHTPSEHLLDGVTFPLEMHIVNVWNDSANGNKPSYMVVAVLFKIGAENKFINEFLNNIPHEEGQKNALADNQVKPEDLLTQFPGNESKSYYTYKGSLTTPPYTESVQWVIMKHILEASEEQVMAIEKMEGNNARHVQAINDRKVYNQ